MRKVGPHFFLHIYFILISKNGPGAKDVKEAVKKISVEKNLGKHKSKS